MDTKYIPILTDALKSYYKVDEIVEMCKLIDVDVELDETDLSLMKFAEQLIIKIEHDNNRRYIEAIVPSLLSRAQRGASESKWNKQEFHQTMVSNLNKIAADLGEAKIPEEVSVSENKPFTAKSEIRELLSAAETEVTIVDNYIGLGTLDCLRDVEHLIRVLTGEHSSSIANDFDRGLKDFISEGYKIEVRRHPKLHDRFILFNDRCWLVGSSLKDAGKKILNIIECVDVKDSIYADMERKWKEASKYTI